MAPRPTKWQSYEQVAGYLLDQFACEFGLGEVQGKQLVTGKHTSDVWEIDGKGVASDQATFIVVECRRYTSSRIKKKDVASLAYVICDVGADGGIMVSPLGLQRGAAIVAEAENIVSVILDQDSTTSDYILRFLDSIRVGCSGAITATGQLSARVIRKDGGVEDIGPL